jgi:hypothetical protein
MYNIIITTIMVITIMFIIFICLCSMKFHHNPKKVYIYIDTSMNINHFYFPYPEKKTSFLDPLNTTLRDRKSRGPGCAESFKRMHGVGESLATG